MLSENNPAKKPKAAPPAGFAKFAPLKNGTIPDTIIRPAKTARTEDIGGTTILQITLSRCQICFATE